MSRLLTPEDFQRAIVDRLPDTFPRARVPELLNGLISAQHLRNLEAQHGKPASFIVGNKAMYHKDDFVAWAREYYHVDDTSGDGEGLQGDQGTPHEAGEDSQGTEGRERG